MSAEPRQSRLNRRSETTGSIRRRPRVTNILSLTSHWRILSYLIIWLPPRACSAVSGLILWDVFRQRDDYWAFGRYKEGDVPIAGLTYFSVNPQLYKRHFDVTSQRSERVTEPEINLARSVDDFVIVQVFDQRYALTWREYHSLIRKVGHIGSQAP